MKYVIKRDNQKTEIFQLEGYVLSPPLATVNKNTITLNTNKSVLRDAEFIEALLASFPDWKFEVVKEEESAKPDLPPVEQAVYSCILTGPCKKSDIGSATGFNKQKIGVALGGLLRKGRIVAHPNGEYTVVGESPSSTDTEEASEPPVEPEPIEPQPWVRKSFPIPEEILTTVYGSETPVKTEQKRVLVVGGLEDKVRLRDMNERFRDFTFEWLPTYRDSSRNMKFLKNTSATYDVVVILEGLVSHSVNDKVVQWCKKNKTRFTHALKGGRASIATALNVAQ